MVSWGALMHSGGTHIFENPLCARPCVRAEWRQSPNTGDNSVTSVLQCPRFPNVEIEVLAGLASCPNVPADDQ